MNKVKKGRRFEKRVAEIYQKDGYITYRPIWTKYHQKDIFGLWDGANYHPRRRELVFWQAKTRREDFSKEIKENLLNFTPYIVGIIIAFSNSETGEVEFERIAEYRLARVYGNSDNSKNSKKIRNRNERPRGDGRM